MREAADTSSSEVVSHHNQDAPTPSKEDPKSGRHESRTSPLQSRRPDRPRSEDRRRRRALDHIIPSPACVPTLDLSHAQPRFEICNARRSDGSSLSNPEAYLRP
jgi:hypothetical protein